ncbi:ImmA/IrrE family metallo-endopeptidase (plasmid) [Kribbella sp. CWNU-51]
MSGGVEIRIEWLDAPKVSTPELAATWARYEVWVGNRCATQLEAADGTFRRSVFGSLYPLAEWIASNWWVLTSHVRPSAIESEYWTWSNVRVHNWLRSHNFRGAGDGMAWPNLTLVLEGAVAHAVWAPDVDQVYGSIRFVSGGSAFLPGDEAIEGLARLVDNVLQRLTEAGLPKTWLAEEWQAIASTSAEEQEFCRAVARLGRDPYSVSDELAADVVRVASDLPVELVADFFDSADVDALNDAARWTSRALGLATRASKKADASLIPLYEVASATSTDVFERPWQVGYALARSVREQLNSPPTEPFDTLPWVGSSVTTSPSYGLQGVVAVQNDHCGVALGGPPIGRTGAAFRRARALGHALARPDQHSFVLSAARGYSERVAGAFAAELLAPAAGIRETLDAVGEIGDLGLESVAQHFGVSPLVVRHQYANQLAGTTR